MAKYNNLKLLEKCPQTGQPVNSDKCDTCLSKALATDKKHFVCMDVQRKKKTESA